MRPESERSVEAYLKKRVAEVGGLTLKLTSPSTRGVPDRIIVYQGRVVFVEVKTITGKLTRGQVGAQRALKEHGADVHVVYGKVGVDALLSAPPFVPARNGRRARAAG